MKDMKARFESTNQTGQGLEDLIDLFAHGKKRPIKLLLEPGLEYCRQLEKNPQNIAMERAGKVYSRALENGYEPSWQLLYKHIGVETVLDEKFVELSEQILMPLLRECDDA